MMEYKFIHLDSVRGPPFSLRSYLKVFYVEKMNSLSHVRLCDHMDCSLPGSSVHGIFQVRILGWVAIFFSRGSSRPRDQTQVSRIAGRSFSIWATREVPIRWKTTQIQKPSAKQAKSSN